MSNLADERDFLLRSLADLEAERAAGDLADVDYRALKDQYTARAAMVLRRLQGIGGPATGPSTSARAPRPWWRLALGVVLTGVIAVGAGVAVARSSGQRQPGQQISGGLPASQQAKVDALLARARENLGAAPVESLKTFDQVLKLDPNQMEALTYRGWLLFQAGLVAEGLEWLDRAVAADPTYPDARVFRGIARFRGNGDAAAGAADLREFLRLAPENPMAPVVKQTLAEAEAEAEAPAPTPAERASPE